MSCRGCSGRTLRRRVTAECQSLGVCPPCEPGRLRTLGVVGRLSPTTLPAPPDVLSQGQLHLHHLRCQERGRLPSAVLEGLSVFESPARVLCCFACWGCGCIWALTRCHLQIHLREDSATPLYPVQLLNAGFPLDFSRFVVR